MIDYQNIQPYKRLLAWLDMNDGSGYGCIEINHKDEVKRFIQQLQNHCPLPVREVDFSPYSDNPLVSYTNQGVTIQNHTEKYGPNNILVFTNLDLTVDTTEESINLLVQDINFNRENYRLYPSIILMVIPKWLMIRLYNQAPDFISCMGFHTDFTDLETHEALVVPLEKQRLSYHDLSMKDTYLKSMKDESGRKSTRLQRAKKFVEICISYYQNSEQDKENIEYALSFAEELKNDVRLETDRINLLTDIAQYYRELNEETKAKKILRDAQTASVPKTSDPREQAAFYDARAKAFSKTYDYEHALNASLQALLIREKNIEFPNDQDKRNLSWTLMDIGDAYESLGAPGKANEYYKKSHEILSRLSEDTGTVESLRDLAISYERLGGIEAAFGRPREAQEYYEKELEIAKRLLDEIDTVDARRFISVVYSFLGDISKSLGDHEKSQEYYKKSLGIRERLSEETGTVESLDDLAVSYYKIGSIVLDNSEKMKYYQKASDIWNDLRKKYPSVKMFADRYRIVSNVMKDIPDVKPKSGRKSWFKWFKK